uniref:FTH domain-containing protein n=1 Tax=Panagrellus redivivus TaxID=6233 RepID=A0A7E4ZSU5_PANRE
MPFPLRTLVPDLHLRLRDLSSPTEAYQLQIAAGNVPLALGKTQMCEQYDKLRLKRSINVDDLRVFKHDGELKQIEVSKNHVYEVTNTLWLDSFHDGDENDWFFDHLVINADDLRIVQSQVSGDFLKNIVSRFTKPIKWFSQSMTPVQQSLSYGAIFRALPDAEVVSCDFVYPGWLQDITSTNKTGLKFLRVEGLIRDFLTFTVEELTDFFIKQDTSFVLEWESTDTLKRARNIPVRIKNYLEETFFVKGKPITGSRFLRVQIPQRKYEDCPPRGPTCYQLTVGL